MNCKDCSHYVHNPADGVWCKIHGEFYQKVITGHYHGISEPIDYSFTNASICGDFK